jgi:hypothetical protein
VLKTRPRRSVDINKVQTKVIMITKESRLKTPEAVKEVSLAGSFGLVLCVFALYHLLFNGQRWVNTRAR